MKPSTELEKHLHTHYITMFNKLREIEHLIGDTWFFAGDIPVVRVSDLCDLMQGWDD